MTEPLLRRYREASEAGGHAVNITVHTPIAAGSLVRFCEPVGNEIVTRASMVVESDCRSATFAGIEKRHWAMGSPDDLIVIIDAPGEWTPTAAGRQRRVNDHRPPYPPLVHIHQTLTACPSEWFAWDAAGNWYYLRYRFGRGTVEVCTDGPAPGSDHLVFVDALSNATLIEEFRHGHDLDGEIRLIEFLELAGMEQATADADDATIRVGIAGDDAPGIVATGLGSGDGRPQP